MKIKKHNRKNGFMMVEIIVAISIIVISILAMMSVTQKTIFVSRQSLHATQASFLLEEGAEVVRILRDNSWDNISGLVSEIDYYPVFSSTWDLSSVPTTVGIFTRTINIANVNRNITTADISAEGTEDADTKFITVVVSWNEGGQLITKTLSFYIMNIFS